MVQKIIHQYVEKIQSVHARSLLELSRRCCGLAIVCFFGYNLQCLVRVNNLFFSPPCGNPHRRYRFQAVYTTGMLALIAYDLYFELWPIFFPAVFELACLLYLTGLKIYFEEIRSPEEAEAWDLRKDTRSSDTSAETVSPERKYSRLGDEEGSSDAGDSLTKQDMLDSNYGSAIGSVNNGDEQA